MGIFIKAVATEPPVDL